MSDTCPVCEQPRTAHDPRCGYQKTHDAQMSNLHAALGQFGAALRKSLSRVRGR